MDLLAQFGARHDARADKLRITRPTPDELSAALDELATKTTACGRCTWVCQNPHPGMPQFQMCAHALRHRAIEAQDDDELGHTYRMTAVIWDEWAHHISGSELERRGINPRDIPRLMWQTYA